MHIVFVMHVQIDRKLHVLRDKSVSVETMLDIAKTKIHPLPGIFKDISCLYYEYFKSIILYSKTDII